MMPLWLWLLLAVPSAAGLYFARTGDVPGAICVGGIAVVAIDILFSFAVMLGRR
jgi:hypothetical protein